MKRYIKLLLLQLFLIVDLTIKYKINLFDKSIVFGDTDILYFRYNINYYKIGMEESIIVILGLFIVLITFYGLWNKYAITLIFSCMSNVYDLFVIGGVIDWININVISFNISDVLIIYSLIKFVKLCYENCYKEIV